MAPGWETQPPKTFWDLLQLLIVPSILIGALAFWNHSETARGNHRADQQRQDTAISVYIDKMSNLILHERLLRSKPGAAVRVVARTATLATLRAVDRDRKAAVLHFLYDTGLLRLPSPPVLLKGADLTRARLEEEKLGDARLEGSDLSFAKLGGAYLARTNFKNADLEKADLGDADLRNAHLEDADLSGAFLDGANLQDAHVEGARLAGATFLSSHVRPYNKADLYRSGLTNVDLRSAHLDDANLTGATLVDADLRDATFIRANLHSAILRGADLRGADLSSADLREADFDHANLDKATLAGAKLRDATNLDLGRYITGLSLHDQKDFLAAEKGLS